MEQSPSWGVVVANIDKKFSAFCGTRMFIVAFIRAYHCTHSTPSHPPCIRSILTLSFHPPSGLFTLVFPSRTFYFTHFSYLPCVLHYMPPISSHCLVHPNNIWWKVAYKSCSFSLCSFLQRPVTSFMLGPDILLSILFSNTLNLCSFCSVRDQVFHNHSKQQGCWLALSKIFANLH
jgi:hypothetical protein